MVRVNEGSHSFTC